VHDSPAKLLDRGQSLRDLVELLGDPLLRRGLLEIGTCVVRVDLIVHIENRVNSDIRFLIGLPLHFRQRRCVGLVPQLHHMSVERAKEPTMRFGVGVRDV